MSAVTRETVGGSHVSSTALSPGPALDWDEEPDLALITTEIEKSTSTPRGVVNWRLLLEKSTTLLETSRDWVLLCVAARASVNVRGASSLPAAVDRLANAATSDTWPAIHPGLSRGPVRRARYLEWFESGVAEDLASGGIRDVSASPGDIATALERVHVLEERLQPLLGKSYPGVRRLREQLERLVQSGRPGVTPEPTTSRADAADTRSPQVQVAVVEFPPSPESLTSVDAVQGVLDKARAALRLVANKLQDLEPDDAQAYRIRRAAAWMTVAAIESTNGRLRSPGPTQVQAEQLRRALDADPQYGLEKAEDFLSDFPLWLDVNYVAFLALTAIGNAKGGASVRVFHALADAVRAETVALVRRVPGLQDLEFANGTPLADVDTRNWLDATLAEPPKSSKLTSDDPRAADDPLAMAEQEASELAQQGSLEDSFRVLDDGMREATSGRDRFRWRLAASRHAARHGRLEVAVDLLDELDREAVDTQLERWEPEICADVLKALLSVGAKGTNQPESLRADILRRRPDAIKRLARLDLMEALRLTKQR